MKPNQNRFGVLLDFFGPDPDGPYLAFREQHLVSASIVRSRGGSLVDSAVDFDSKAEIGAVEIQDERADRVLAAELQSTKPAVP